MEKGVKLRLFNFLTGKSSKLACEDTSGFLRLIFPPNYLLKADANYNSLTIQVGMPKTSPRACKSKMFLLLDLLINFIFTLFLLQIFTFCLILAIISDFFFSSEFISSSKFIPIEMFFFFAIFART